METSLKKSEWPSLLDSRLKALSTSLAKIFAIEISRQKNVEEIRFLRNQVDVIIHQLRNPLAALRTYAKLLIKRLGSDKASIEIVESMMSEQNQINSYISSFEEVNKALKVPFGIENERLLLLPNLDSGKNTSIKELLIPILDRGKANAKLQNRLWMQPSIWPEWANYRISNKYGVIAEIVANLLENAFKYSEENADIGMLIGELGLCIFDNGTKIPEEESEEIFKKGFRGIASKEKEGTGVGLYLARKLARQINGDLMLIRNLNEIKISKGLQIEKINFKNIFFLRMPIKLLQK